MDIMVLAFSAGSMCVVATSAFLLIALYRIPFSRTRAGGLRALGFACVFGAVGALSFLLSFWAGRRERETGTAPLLRFPTLGSIGATVTMSEYQQVQPGMTYDDVSRIIGAGGTETARSELGGYAVVLYTWQNPNGSNMIASFSQGKLTSKAQSNLP